MPKVESFLSNTEEQEIIEAICKAESNTSGEIRVHIEDSCNGKDSSQRALEVFLFLNMQNTKASNAVLFYIAVSDRSFAIYGDKGIHKNVSDHFWDDVKETLKYHFKNNDFKNGLVKGISMTGEKLRLYFPCDPSDENELSNTISKG